MNWLDKQVSIYKCMADNTGRAATFRDVLLADFGIEHEWYFKDYDSNKWHSGSFNDISTIVDLRTREMTKKEKLMLKSTMQCYTPAALLKTKKKGEVETISRTGIMQLDFDYADIKDYDIEELKQAVFSLPFVAFCGLSCSGNGFYALVSIGEPEKLTEYAEHCFAILKRYGVPPDTSKGRNVNDLRFVSYDTKMLIRDNPETLHIKRFAAKKKPVYTTTSNETVKHSSKIVNDGLAKIRAAVEGNRWQTVQKVAYTLGGLNEPTLLNEIKETINTTSQFAGLEEKYYQCAADCFTAGKQNPL